MLFHMTQKVPAILRHRLRVSFYSVKLQPQQQTDTAGAPIGNLRQLKIQ
jgi:hypothetical protein